MYDSKEVLTRHVENMLTDMFDELVRDTTGQFDPGAAFLEEDVRFVVNCLWNTFKRYEFVFEHYKELTGHDDSTVLMQYLISAFGWGDGIEFWSFEGIDKFVFEALTDVAGRERFAQFDVFYDEKLNKLRFDR